MFDYLLNYLKRSVPTRLWSTDLRFCTSTKGVSTVSLHKYKANA